MKKALLVFTISIHTFTTVFSQTENETFICGQDQFQKAQEEKQAGYMQQMRAKWQMLQQLAEYEAIYKSSDKPSYLNSAPTTIPIVVHVMYNTAAENISDAQILSQIDVFNADYQRLNTDASNTPAPFQSVAGHPNFYFCMAQRDPNGNATNGIERRQVSVAGFAPSDNYGVKTYAGGGMDAWDPKRYLNIWICNITGGVGGWGESAAQDPPQETMGAVVKYNVYGTTGTLLNGYTKGRCAVHEVGHCFDLNHIWGPNNGGGSCSDSDYINDTPNQYGITSSCATFPKLDQCTTSGNGIMFMNYMDYPPDACKNMFTAGQGAYMNLSYNNSQKTFATSNSCVPPGSTFIHEQDRFNVEFIMYPNPANDVVTFKPQEQGKTFTISIYDNKGALIESTFNDGFSNTVIDLSTYANGSYLVQATSERYSFRSKLMVAH